MAALADLPGLAARISSALTREDIPHAITGVVAMASHGYVRATQDLDILVVATAMQLPRVFQIVRDQGLEGDNRQLIEAIRERYVAALHAGPVTVEILVPVLPYHRTIIQRAAWVDVPEGRIPFVSVEDLVILKMLWHRAKDVPDVHALISTTASLDGRYITNTLKDILPSEDPRHAEIVDLLRRFGPA